MSTTPSNSTLTIEFEAPGYVELVLSLMIIWGFGDSLSTVLASTVTGSVAGELNPWIQMLLSVEPLIVIFLKGAVVLYVGVVLIACQDVIEQVPGWRIWFLTVIGLGVGIVLQNLAIAFHAM